MKAKILMTILAMILIVTGCSKSGEKTPAKVKLNLSKIINFSGGIGQGGAILFGKSSTGEQFGKFISSTEDNLELSNGNWVFYAVMWEKLVTHFDSTAYCGTSSQELKGQAVSISLNLNNANCASEVFSGTDGYVSSGFNRFANAWIEECDELSQTGATNCKRDNQGSAVSYRFVFKSYKKSSNGALTIGTDPHFSGCLNTTSGGVLENATNLNFPTGNSGMPFVISVEMFQGSSDCTNTIPETKGVYTYTFDQGLGASTAGNKMVKSGVNFCTPSSTANACYDDLGSWTGSSCASTPMVVNMFNTTNCLSGPTAISDKNIKQMVSMPKSFLCRFNDSMSTGTASFPGGAGTLNRPYKICNEWQMNQVGEYNSSLSGYTFLKLMNDLDMNKAGLTGYPAPHCAGLDNYDSHLNLNPIDKIECDSASNARGFSGVFNGNNKTISNARISSESNTLNYFGFVRELGGTVKNLTFKGLEVRSRGTKIGGIAGYLNGGTAVVSNVTIIDGDIEGASSVGMIAGETSINSKIIDTNVKYAEVHGADLFGGLAGSNAGTIEKSSFRGVVSNETYQSGNYAGGLAATNSGTIKNSFSEGVLSSTTSYAGGIAGGNMASSTISVVYSTMAMISTQEASAAFFGGILGKNNGGYYEDCFADTSVLQFGSTSLTKHGILGSNNGGSSSTSSCYTDSSKIFSPHPGHTYSDIRIGVKPSDVSFVQGNGNWSFSAGDTPRLSWESGRLCSLANNQLPVASQVSTLGRGSATSPVIICTLDQFNQMDGRSASEFYNLEADINMGPWSYGALNIFNGKLDGRGHVLYGMDITHNNSSPETDWGIIKENHGTIKNLSLSANRLVNNDTNDSVAGLLVATNYGVIQNVQLFGNVLQIHMNGGGIAGVNIFNGVATIEDSSVEVTKVTGVNNIGGVVGSNSGVVRRVFADILVGLAYSGFSWDSFGGIVGSNGGDISESSVTGRMIFTETTNSATNESIGAVAGTNAGDIWDSFVETGFEMTVSRLNAVGGLVGYMSNSIATLNTSFFAGRINIFNITEANALADLDTVATTDERKVGPLVGKSTTGASITNSFYAANSLVWPDSTNYIVSSCGSPGTLIVDAAPPTSATFRTDGGESPGGVSYTASGTTITYNPLEYVCNPADNFKVGKYLNNYAEYGTSKTRTQLKDINTFSAYGIAGGNEQIVMDYYVAIMSGQPIPTGSPVWVIDNGDKFPKLLQSKH